MASRAPRGGPGFRGYDASPALHVSLGRRSAKEGVQGGPEEVAPRQVWAKVFFEDERGGCRRHHGEGEAHIPIPHVAGLALAKAMLKTLGLAALLAPSHPCLLYLSTVRNNE